MQLIQQSYRRSTLYQIQKFILYGGEAKCDPPESYSEQCEQIYANIEDLLRRAISDSNTVDRILSEINNYTGCEQEHAMLLGMQFGASLLHELLGGTNNIT